MNNLIEVKNKDGQLVVTSRQIANDFEKRHSHVVEAIENKIKSLTTENSDVKLSKLFIPTTFKHNGNEYKVSALENKMTIDYAQQEELSSLAKRVVVQALGGKNAPAYRILSKKAFSTLWTDFKRIMQVNSYKNTAVKQFYRAKEIINNWQPNSELRLMILGANSQQVMC